MGDRKGNLYLYEAIELRNEYDRHIGLLQGLLGEPSKRRGIFNNDDEDKEPVTDFDPKEAEEKLKKLQIRRVKLNQKIQETNFEEKIDCEGENISIAEALVLRKNLLTDLNAVAARVEKSSYRRVIHKEGRDIFQEPRHKFDETYKEYKKFLHNSDGWLTRSMLLTTLLKLNSKTNRQAETGEQVRNCREAG